MNIYNPKAYESDGNVLISGIDNFGLEETFDCGQAFRWKPYDTDSWVGIALGRKLRVGHKNGIITLYDCTLKEYEEKWRSYFDIDRDYSSIIDIISSDETLKAAAAENSGIRVLKQDKWEALCSFIISQNNNIPRIKGIIERLCAGLGKKVSFKSGEYFAFPTVKDMANAPLEFYKSIGLGYRAEYILRLAKEIEGGLDVVNFNALDTLNLKRKLITLYGVGPKVADCVALFGYHRSDSFPVDTWIEKVYVQDFNGKLKDRSKIADELVKTFGQDAGYFQQYLFYYKRTLQAKE